MLEVFFIMSKIDFDTTTMIKPAKKVNHKFKISEFPKTYLSANIKDQIETVKTYYKVLDTPKEKSTKVCRSKSPIKLAFKRKVSFNFKSRSSSRIITSESNKVKCYFSKRRETFNKHHVGVADENRKFISVEGNGILNLLKVSSGILRNKIT